MDIDTLFRALSDPTRREILDHILRNGTSRAGDIAGAFPAQTRPGISKHLRILREAGLITQAESDDGRERAYAVVTPSPLIQVMAWLKRYEQFWQDRLDDLVDQIESDD